MGGLRWLVRVWLVSGGFLTACTPQATSPVRGGGGSSGGPVDLPALPPENATEEPGESDGVATGIANSDESETSDGAEIDPDLSDLGEALIDCDVWAQDCPRGQKCAPWVGGGPGAPWYRAVCVEVVDRPRQLGDLCSVVAATGGSQDDCDYGLRCTFTDEDGEGFCLEQCRGEPDEPSCGPLTTCVLGVREHDPRCFPLCDVATKLCPVDGMVCQYVEGTTTAVCAPSK